MTSRLGKRDRDVYKWEDECVGVNDRALVDQHTAGVIVNHVWERRGLRHPPRVETHRARGATGTRHRIVIPEAGIQTWVILHEMAHSMDFSIEMAMGELTDRLKDETLTGSTHDDNWLGIYMNLLNDFMGPKFNKLYLMKTLHDRGLTYSLTPVIRCK